MDLLFDLLDFILHCYAIEEVLLHLLLQEVELLDVQAVLGDDLAGGFGKFLRESLDDGVHGGQYLRVRHALRQLLYSQLGLHHK